MSSEEPQEEEQAEPGVLGEVFHRLSAFYWEFERFRQRSVLHALYWLREFVSEERFSALFAWYWRSFWSAEHRRQKMLHGEDVPAIRNSERALLLERICSAYPFNSCFEFGCAYGTNFDVLARLFPKVRFLGMDISVDRARLGEELLRARGLHNVDLCAGHLKELRRVPTDSFDVVLTSAVLLYVPPSEIMEIIPELLRIAKSRVILLEQHHRDPLRDPHGAGVEMRDAQSERQYWIRDFQSLLGYFVSDEQVSIRRVPAPLWDTEQWKQHAHVIDIAVDQGQPDE